MEENKNQFEGQAGMPLAQPAQNSSEVVTPGATGITDENILPETEAAATETINPTQAKEMEVHHHGHVHEKKKWKEYLFQFLMLFLAVFCGFLAEYQLEHKIERDREQQFISSLLEDLAEDTLAFSATIKSYGETQKRNDTLIGLLSSKDVKSHGSLLYYLGRSASRSVRLAIHDATIQQLRNSGGLRLIRNQKVSKATIEYYNRLVFINYLQQIEDSETSEYRKMATEVFHPVLFNGIVIESNNTIIIPPGNPALLTYDSKILFRIAGMVSYIRNTQMGLAKAETEMQTAAQKLIELITNEYNLENE
jgi:hypothetical protein